MTLLQESPWQPLIRVALLVGGLCRLTGILSENGAGQIGKLVLRVTSPVILLRARARSDLLALAHEGRLVVLAGVLVPLFKLPAGQASVVRVHASLSDTVLAGIPVCTALWGVRSTLLAGLSDQGLNLPLSTRAPLEYGRASQKATWRWLVLSPMIWGLPLGVLWNPYGLGLAPWVTGPLGFLRDVALPLLLTLIGGLAVPSRLKGGIKPLAAFLSCRRVFVPLIVSVFTLAIGFNGAATWVTMIQSAMPASVTATVMAKECGGDSELVATGVLYSIVLSLLTIPLIAAIVVRA
jgi:hypothetical protein